MTVEQSYRYCAEVARSRARNFYYSFILLSKPQRKAMYAVYAFMRYCDDLSDNLALSDRAASIAQWSSELNAALAGRFSNHPVWPAFHDAVRRYSIPHDYFHQMIAGVSSDLEPRRVQTFDELYRYCYQVASVVGLTIVHIFGFRSQEALVLAEKCGIAFQLTNILRDVREDAGLNRVYLPLEDLSRFGVAAEEIAGGKDSLRLRDLLAFEATRAKNYYKEALPLIGMVDSKSRSSLWALIEIYRRLLDRIERSGYDVLHQRIHVPAREKMWIVARGLLGPAQ